MTLKTVSQDQDRYEEAIKFVSLGATYTKEQAISASLAFFDGDEIAADVFVNKYALRDKYNNYYELIPDHTHLRLAKEFAIAESKYPNPMSEQEIFNLMVDFEYVVPQGSPLFGIGNNFQKEVSVSNCFVIPSPYDSIGGIAITDQQSQQIYKRRGGVGIDLSTIRPSNITTNNASLKSDSISIWMEKFSNSCISIAQSGRRGALMLTLSCHHPDVEDFINVKSDRKKVTGANVSVRISEEFMNAVKNDGLYEQKFPIDSNKPIVSKQVKAKDIWKQIVKNATKNAEPGVLFWDNVSKYSPPDIYKEEGFKSISTNPCFTGDTCIATVDKGAISLKDLAQTGKDVRVYSINLEGKVSINWGRNPRKTGYRKIFNLKIIDEKTLTTHNINCTEDHEFISVEINKVLAKDLKINEYLFSKIGEKRYKVLSFEDLNKQDDVYNITVENDHTYGLVLTDPKDFQNTLNGIFVHNCGEIVLSANFDACRLIAMNLFGFVKNPFTKSSYFDFYSFEEHVQKAQRLMDDMVDIEAEKISFIISKIESDPEPDHVKITELSMWKKVRETGLTGRRTGLGVLALGDCLAALNLLYGSDSALDMVNKIFKTLAINAYKSSCIMAGERGTFPIYNYNKEIGHPYLERLFAEDKELYDLYRRNGKRNIALLTCSPTGSIATLCKTSSGVEPVFLTEYQRARKLNSEELKTTTPDRIDEVGIPWKNYIIYHPKYKMWMDISGETEYEKSPYYKATSDDIHWKAHVDTQSICQHWIDHSISKTVNLPKDTSEELVSSIYMYAHEKKLKGITIFVKGCRTGVLSNIEKDEKVIDIKENNAIKRPKELNCDIQKVKFKGNKYVALIGLLNNKPYEVFFGSEDKINIPQKFNSGKIIKKTKGIYHLALEDGSTIENIVQELDNAEMATISRLVSMSLRHGVGLEFIIDQLNKDGLINTFNKVLARVLKKYIPEDKAVSGEVCIECKSDKLVYSEGCKLCLNCGKSKCG